MSKLPLIKVLQLQLKQDFGYENFIYFSTKKVIRSHGSVFLMSYTSVFAAEYKYQNFTPKILKFALLHAYLIVNSMGHKFAQISYAHYFNPEL